jgi:hypothetical protein
MKFLCANNMSLQVVIRGCIQKFPDWPPGARTANCMALCHYGQFYRYFVSLFSEFCLHNPLCCFSRVFIVVSIYFVIDSVRKLLVTPSYNIFRTRGSK